MSNPKWKFGLLAVTVLVSVFAVFVLLRFSVASAANVVAANSSKGVNANTTAPLQEADQDIAAQGHWILVANLISSNLSILNTANNIVYGPFLQGELGSDGGGRFDIDVTPDGRTALISNFGDSKIFFIDLADPMSLSVTAAITIPMFAEDIAISEDGKFAVVADGGFSTRLATIDIASATLVYTADLGTESPQSVIIAPDGTIAVADYFYSAVHTYLLDDMGVITTGHTYTYTYPGYAITDTEGMPRPVNLGLAPDGETIIVCDAVTATIGVYRIVAPGVLTFTGVVTGLQGTFPIDENHYKQAVQSVAFNEAGDKAVAIVNHYYYSSTAYQDRIAVLDINGPGQVSLEAGGVVTIPHTTGSQFFGVDTVVVADNQAYLGYPSGSTPDNPTNLAIVNLTNYNVTTTMVLSHEISLPTGVAAVPIRLGMKIMASNPEPLPNQVITYTLVLSSAGPKVTGLTIQDVLPAGVTFVGPITLDPPGAGTVGSAPPDLATGVVISPYQQVTVTLPVLVGAVPDGTHVINTASADSPELFQPVKAEVSLVMKWLKLYLPIIFNDFVPES